jgi:Fe-S-cluster containining protein
MAAFFVMDLIAFNKSAINQQKENQAFYRKLKSKTPKNLDGLFEKAHNDVFESTDCLTCANCCKTTSPIFYQRDVERASKALRMKPGTFIETYLRIDEEKDLVFKAAPCPFLESDNRCRIYEDRPTACREYPHTDRKRIHQILDLTYRNTVVCPAVLQITERLKAVIKI